MEEVIIQIGGMYMEKVTMIWVVHVIAIGQVISMVHMIQMIPMDLVVQEVLITLLVWDIQKKLEVQEGFLFP